MPPSNDVKSTPKIEFLIMNQLVSRYSVINAPSSYRIEGQREPPSIEQCLLVLSYECFCAGLRSSNCQLPVLAVELIRPASPCNRISQNPKLLIQRLSSTGDKKTFSIKRSLNDFSNFETIVGWQKSANKPSLLLEKWRYIVPVTDSKFCFVFHLDSDLKDEELSLILTSHPGKILEFAYHSLYAAQFLELEAVYSNIAHLFFRSTQPLVLSQSKMVLEHFTKVQGNNETVACEKWMEALYLGSLLRKDVTDDPLHGELQNDSQACQNHHAKCDQEALCTQGGGTLKASSITSSHASCPCLQMLMRRHIWSKYKEKSKTLFSDFDLDDFVAVLTEKLALPDVWDIAYPEELGLFDHLPASRQREIAEWSLRKRHEIEYAHTILFSIYTLTLLYQGRADEPEIRHFQRLWGKLEAMGPDSSLQDLIRGYLLLWQQRIPNEQELFLSQDWLIAWFSLRLIESLSYESHVKNPCFSPEDTLKYYQALATLYLYVLFWMRKFGQTSPGVFSDVEKGYEGFLDSLIYLVCEYAHIDGELSRQAELYRTMFFMWAQQSALYTMADNYRDHLHHVLEVCLLGLFFMELKRENGQGTEYEHFFPLYGACPGKRRNWRLLRKLSENVFSSRTASPDKKDWQYLLRNWIVSALMHDVGYAVKLLGMPLDHLAFFQEEIVTTFWDNMRAAHSEQKTELGPKSWRNLQSLAPDVTMPSVLEDLDHGVVSALQIAHLVAAPNDAWKEDMQPAIEAAAMHNHPDIDMSPASHPMAFLLYLCDNLQEWDRPFIKGQQFRFSLLVNIVRTGANGLHKSRSYVNYLILENVYVDDARVGPTLQENSVLHCILDFAPAWNMEYYPPITWVGHGRALQRTKGCALPITISLRHPVQKREEALTGSSLEINHFQTFLRESGKSAPALRKTRKSETGNSVLRQWLCDARKRQLWFEYMVQNLEDDCFEVMSFHLHKAEGKRHIPKTPDYYIPHYIEWVRKYRKGIYEQPEMSSFMF